MKKQKKQEFSAEKNNLEIVVPEIEKSLAEAKDEAVEISPEKIEVKKGGNIVIGSLNVFTEPLKKRHEKFYQNSKFHLWADIILVALILSGIGAYFFARHYSPHMDIVLSGQPLSKFITSGKVENFEINYANDNDESASNASLAITLPKNFVLTAAEPKEIFNTQTNTFKIGDLEAGAAGKVKISGQVSGEIGERQVLAFVMNYQRAGARDRELGSVFYDIEDSVIGLEISLPENIPSGLDFPGRIKIKNNGEKDLEGSLEIFFSNGNLKIKSVDSCASLVNGAIFINYLRAGEEKEIGFTALFEEKEGKHEAALEVYLNSENKKIKQKEILKSIKVINADLKASVISPVKKSIKEGESSVFKINYLNGGQEAIKNLRLSFSPTNNAFSVSDFKISAGAKIGEEIKAEGTVLNFSKNIAPQEEGKFDIAVSFKRKKAEINQEIGLQTVVSYEIGNQDISYEIIGGKLRLLSDLRVKAQGLYYSAQGDQLGIGPLPPVVGVPTRYWIFWEIENFGNSQKDLIISGDLPFNVAWTDKMSLTAGKMRFAPISNKVIWDISEMAADSGKIRAGFEVELTPLSEDLGKIPNLVNNMEYGSFDSFASAEISGRLENINTDLKDDNLSSGKGKVIRMEIIK